MQQHASTYSVLTHTLDPCGGVKGQNCFSESSHVVYKIKWNRECSNMQAHILSLHTPSTPALGSKVKFSESSPVAYQIRREWNIEHHASTYFVLTHRLDPWVGSKVKTSLLKVKLHINLTEWSTDHHASTYSVLTHTSQGRSGLPC